MPREVMLASIRTGYYLTQEPADSAAKLPLPQRETYCEGKDGFGIYREEAGSLGIGQAEKIADTLTDFLVKGTGIDTAITL